MQDKWNDELRRAYDRGYWDRDREMREHEARRRSGNQSSDYRNAGQQGSESRGSEQYRSEQQGSGPGNYDYRSAREDEWRQSNAQDYPPGERTGYDDRGGSTRRDFGGQSGYSSHDNDRARRTGLESRGDYGNDRDRYSSGEYDYRGRDDRDSRDDRDLRDRPGHRLNEHRDFLSRAGDEVRSWFGDDHALNRRRMDDVRDNHERQRGWEELRNPSRNRDDDRTPPF